ncbi:MAG: hypothetical protein HY084_11725 [Gemmatimonadetes bacterium]|nr:hypothetical protein [Gemmatimonadota bacterium]
MIVLALALLPRPAHAIPAWARRYNVNCSFCHSPSVPRLNATGIGFKWAGYRMPEDLGSKVDVTKIENYLSARVIAAYDYATRKNAGTEADAFSVPSASVFAAGPMGTHFGGYLEFERLPDATVDLIGSMTGVWGSEQRFGGFRVGQGHMLMAAGGVAGFDRPTGISMPLAYDESVTDAVPLRLGGDQGGIEAFLVLGGRNRTAVQIVNGVVAGAGMEGRAVSKRDIVLTNQLMWDDVGSGLGLAAYFGTVTGVVANQPDLGKQYVRLAATANKIVGRYELMGGYVYGKDSDVPVDSASTLTRSPAGQSYWAQGQYTFKRSPLSVFGRYEFVDPDRDAVDRSRQRYVLGAVLPINVPEYLRWSIELFRDSYRSAATPERNGLSTQLQFVF